MKNKISQHKNPPANTNQAETSLFHTVGEIKFQAKIKFNANKINIRKKNHHRKINIQGHMKYTNSRRKYNSTRRKKKNYLGSVLNEYFSLFAVLRYDCLVQTNPIVWISSLPCQSLCSSRVALASNSLSFCSSGDSIS